MDYYVVPNLEEIYYFLRESSCSSVLLDGQIAQIIDTLYIAIKEGITILVSPWIKPILWVLTYSSSGNFYLTRRSAIKEIEEGGKYFKQTSHFFRFERNCRYNLIFRTLQFSANISRFVCITYLSLSLSLLTL